MKKDKKSKGPSSKNLDKNLTGALTGALIVDSSMTLTMMYSKIHRATVTEANLQYEGSISIDKKLIKKSGFLLNQKVDIYNCNSGARFSTYVIEGNEGQICLNGAAARHVQKGDIVIIVAYCSMPFALAAQHEPKVVFVDSKNRYVENRKEEHGRKARN